MTTLNAVEIARLRAKTEKGFRPTQAEALALINALETARRIDREAGMHVETVICRRTRFTGEPPYVGWKGLGLALTEALDQRDDLIAALAGLVTRLDEIHADPVYRSVWTIHQTHAGPYTGPTYVDALAHARAVLNGLTAQAVAETKR